MIIINIKKNILNNNKKILNNGSGFNVDGKNGCEIREKNGVKFWFKLHGD
jgi:hypothetical protein